MKVCTRIGVCLVVCHSSHYDMVNMMKILTIAILFSQWHNSKFRSSLQYYLISHRYVYDYKTSTHFYCPLYDFSRVYGFIICHLFRECYINVISVSENTVTIVYIRRVVNEVWPSETLCHWVAIIFTPV